MPLEVQNCCFAVDLRLGSLIIGYIGLIADAIQVLIISMGLSSAAYIMNETTNPNLQRAALFTIIILSISLVFVLLNLILNIVLLTGIYKQNRGMIKAYIIGTAVFIAINVILFITKLAGGVSVGLFLIDLISILLSIYYLIVVRSYCLRLEERANRPPTY